MSISPEAAVSDFAGMAKVLHRPVCDLLGCRFPIVLAGMGGVARSELAVAVTQAGGFAFLGMVREPVALIREEVRRVRERTDRKFGVNVIPAATEPSLLDAQIDACIELGVPVIGLFWDLSTAIVQRLRDAGVLVVCQVGTVAEACAAQDAGAQILIVQGQEAGGHVRGNRPLAQLLPDVLAATSLPVMAAGGIADGADVATLLSLGAQGAVVGTAFIPTHESFAHEFHKQRIVGAARGQTVLTDAFHINWPPGARVRVLGNSVTRGEHGDPFATRRTVIGEEAGRPIYLFSTDSPLRSMTGNFEAMAAYAGEGAGRIGAVVGAAERLHRIVAHAAASLRVETATPPERMQLSSPVCYADEMDAAFMGLAGDEEIVASLNELLEAERAGARVTLRSAAQTQDPELKRLVSAIHRDEVRWCGVLIAAIQSLRATPTTRTGAFHDKAMAIDDLRERMLFLNRGQSWVVRKLRALLPRIRDERICAQLVAMLASHEANIGLVEVRIGPAERAGARVTLRL